MDLVAKLNASKYACVVSIELIRVSVQLHARVQNKIKYVSNLILNSSCELDFVKRTV